MSDRAKIAVFYLMTVGLVLWLTYGTYDRALVWILAAAHLLFALTVFAGAHRGSNERKTSAPSEVVRPLIWCVAASALLLCVSPRIVTATAASAVDQIRILYVTVAGLALAVSLCAEINGTWPSCFTAVGLTMLTALTFAARILTILAAPAPSIDVYWTGMLGCDELLQGHNPYAATYPDIYAGRYEHAPHFFYWPAYLVWIVPARLLAGDIRAATIIADLLTACLTYDVARRLGNGWRTAAALSLLWLVTPVSLLVTEAAWIDPLLIACVAATVWCLVARRWTMLGIALGFTAATKQYGALYAFLVAMYILAQQREWLARVLVGSALTWLALMVPFIAWGPREFFASTMDYYVRAALRTDSLSLIAWAHNEWNWLPSRAAVLALYVAGLVGTIVWLVVGKREPAELLGAAAILFGGIFLGGRLAFCNYYYFVAFLAFAFLVLSWRSADRGVVPQGA